MDRENMIDAVYKAQNYLAAVQPSIPAMTPMERVRDT